MKQNDLMKKMAKLESINDQLVAELRFLDEIARKLGFSDGLKTLKEAALELIEIEEEMGDIISEDEANPPLSG
jgi:hypothetical protein